MTAFDHIPESALKPAPQFYVEPPDNRRDWPEADRQNVFFNIMKFVAPRVLVYPNANGGKRNGRLARKEHILSGVFDVTCVFREHVAWIEFKGWAPSGRAGKLDVPQIEFGNRLVEMDRPCACFFSPHRAVHWLREHGFPVNKYKGVDGL